MSCGGFPKLEDMRRGLCVPGRRLWSWENFHVQYRETPLSLCLHSPGRVPACFADPSPKPSLAASAYNLIVHIRGELTSNWSATKRASPASEFLRYVRTHGMLELMLPRLQRVETHPGRFSNSPYKVSAPIL